MEISRRWTFISEYQNFIKAQVIFRLVLCLPENLCSKLFQFQCLPPRKYLTKPISKEEALQWIELIRIIWIVYTNT